MFFIDRLSLNLFIQTNLNIHYIIYTQLQHLLIFFLSFSFYYYYLSHFFNRLWDSISTKRVAYIGSTIQFLDVRSIELSHIYCSLIYICVCATALSFYGVKQSGESNSMVIPREQILWYRFCENLLIYSSLTLHLIHLMSSLTQTQHPLEGY